MVNEDASCDAAATATSALSWSLGHVVPLAAVVGVLEAVDVVASDEMLPLAIVVGFACFSGVTCSISVISFREEGG